MLLRFVVTIRDGSRIGSVRCRLHSHSKWLFGTRRHLHGPFVITAYRTDDGDRLIRLFYAQTVPNEKQDSSIRRTCSYSQDWALIKHTVVNYHWGVSIEDRPTSRSKAIGSNHYLVQAYFCLHSVGGIDYTRIMHTAQPLMKNNCLNSFSGVEATRYLRLEKWVPAS